MRTKKSTFHIDAFVYDFLDHCYARSSFGTVCETRSFPDKRLLATSRSSHSRSATGPPGIRRLTGVAVAVPRTPIGRPGPRCTRLPRTAEARPGPQVAVGPFGPLCAQPRRKHPIHSLVSCVAKSSAVILICQCSSLAFDCSPCDF